MGGTARPARPRDFVPETLIGRWFLDSWVWSEKVLKVAIADLRRLMPPTPPIDTLLDVGCGNGRSLPQLMAAFRPAHLIGLEHEASLLAAARTRAGPLVSLVQGDCARLPLSDGSVDLIFCHQTFHHLVDQHAVLCEFHRVLRPGGKLLFAESTRAYIETWIIRLFFRHPMETQRTADEYLAMLRAHGFIVAPDSISCPYLWWSRGDLGLAELLGWRPPPPGRREETLLNLVAAKPLAGPR